MQMNILKLIGREEEIFEQDISSYEKELSKIVSNSETVDKVMGGCIVPLLVLPSADCCLCVAVL